jgi:hypothetical protein
MVEATIADVAKFKPTKIHKLPLSDVRKLANKKREFKEQNGNKCVYCGCTNRLILTIDHIIPLVRGGTDDDRNKQVCCRVCNGIKGALTHEEFLKYYKALNDLKDLFKIALILPQTIPLQFNQHYYPECPSEQKTLTNPFGDRYPPVEEKKNGTK